jgi:integrase/recombinase XerD
MKNLINDFKNYNIQLNKSENTIENYLIELNTFLKDFNINTIEDLKQLQEKEFIKYWLQKMNSKNYYIASINKKKNVLSVFSNYLVFENILQENKFKQLPTLKNDNVKIDIYTHEDIEKIFKYIEDKIKENKFQRNIDKNVYKVNLTAIKLLGSCALRVEELCSIKINDIDLTTRKILIRGKGGKGKVTRFNKINLEVMELIKEYLNIRKNIKIKEGNEEYLFISPISKSKITDDSIRRFIKRINKELNIITGSPIHAFRHRRASELIEKGADVKQVSLYLGHANQSTTEKYYIHSTENTIEALSKL